MLKGYQITNFKAFAGPANIPIKPITLIFGANSSGKSAILQSLLLFKQTIETERRQNINLAPKGGLVDLGSFKDFIHNHDENLSFSFKIFVKPHSIEDKARLTDDHVNWEMVDFDPNIDLLDKSLGNETIGVSISISFDPESSTILISHVDLYLGNEPYPVITYKKDGWGPSDYKFKGNFNHKFWEKYWQTFDAEDSTKTDKIIQGDIRDDRVSAAFAKLFREAEKIGDIKEELSGEIKEDIKKVFWETIFPNVSDSERETLIREAQTEMLAEEPGIKSNNKPFPELRDQIQRDETNTELKEDLNGLTGLQRSIEAYKILFKHNQIGLEGPFPRTLDKTEMKYLVNYEASLNHSRDISLLLITAGCLFEQFLKNITYIAPLRKYPQRYYMDSGRYAQHVGIFGEMAPDILLYDNDLVLKVNRELDRFGANYELRIFRVQSEKHEISGFFHLQFLNKSTGVPSSLRDVGFGFSQVLPIIVQSLISKQNILLIEQPELHLHPALQAELGDLFINSALGDQKNRFLIETHSEHLILRILKRIRETTRGNNEKTPPINPEDVSLLFVDVTKTGSTIQELRIDKEGRLIDQCPGGFFEEDFEELF